jgi:hypothetical protein
VKAVPRSLRECTTDNKLSNAIQDEDNLLAKLSLYEEYVRRMTFHASTNVQAELVAVRSELKEQQLQTLEAKDYAIGASAELGVLRFRYQESQNLVDSLAHQLNLLHSSRTWRLGRFVLLPLRAVRKLIRMILQ